MHAVAFLCCSLSYVGSLSLGLTDSPKAHLGTGCVLVNIGGQLGQT